MPSVAEESFIFVSNDGQLPSTMNHPFIAKENLMSSKQGSYESLLPKFGVKKNIS